MLVIKSSTSKARAPNKASEQIYRDPSLAGSHLATRQRSKLHAQLMFSDVVGVAQKKKENLKAGFRHELWKIGSRHFLEFVFHHVGGDSRSQMLSQLQVNLQNIQPSGYRQDMTSSIVSYHQKILNLIFPS